MRCSAPQPFHLGGRPGLVDEHQACRVKVKLRVEPGLSPACYVRPVLLGGLRDFLERDPMANRLAVHRADRKGSAVLALEKGDQLGAPHTQLDIGEVTAQIMLLEMKLYDVLCDRTVAREIAWQLLVTT